MTTGKLRSIEQRTLAIIMGGGAGTRLFPSPRTGQNRRFPLRANIASSISPSRTASTPGCARCTCSPSSTAPSLIRHISAAYKFDQFSRSFVEVLAAQQTPSGSHWYQGTADAVRRNLRDFLQRPYDYFIILSGDQLYRMDYRDVIRQHIEKKSEITIATIPVSRAAAPDFGIMHTDSERRIIRFEEKPKEPALLDELKIPGPLLSELEKDPAEELYQASMGIYVFNRDTLVHALDNDFVDFGKHIIPSSIRDLAVHAYIFQGYWEDIGTIRAFFDANLNLTNPVPEYSFFDSTCPVYTHARFLPASKINGATIKQAIISDGCKIADAHIERAVVGIRSYIGSGTTIRNSIVMGADFYDADMASKEKAGEVPYGIGKNCVIEQTIVDKNARIGDGSAISPEGKPSTMDGDNFYIRDGIVVIPKNAVLPPGTWI